MIDIINAIGDMMDFICSYKLTGCVKTMLLGSLAIVVLLLFSRGKKRSSFGKCYCMLLVFAALLVEQSKLYYTGELFRLSNWLNAVITPFLGKCYFGVMLSLFAIIFVKQLWFRLFIRRHWKPVLFEELPVFAGERIEGKEKRTFWSWYQKRIRIYQQPEISAACSGGVFHPYIVLPVLEEGREMEQTVMLKHELTHIRHGHIFWLNLVVLLRCYWWVNPLVYIWEWHLRRELECVCDELCLMEYGIEQDVYAETMLFVASQCVARGKKYYYETAGTYFMKERRPFFELRYRIINMTASKGRETERIHRNNRYGHILAAGVLIIFLMIGSYPRYTIMSEISLYDGRLKPVFFDDEAVHKAVQISGRDIVIEPETFRELLEQYQVTDEYIYLGYNQILKVPGAGGLGEVAMVSTRDYKDITYLSADTISAKIEKFILKWI